jgi:FkbM family methyltransferase
VSLKETQALFREGKLSKPQYIEAMHRLHRGLFEYAEFIRGTDIAAIEITDGRVVMTARGSGVRVLVDPEDLRDIPVEILNFGAYEPRDSAMMLRLAAGARTIFDIGANIGWYTLAFAKAVPGAAIHAFEPLPPTFRHLQENLALNGAAGVTAHNFGLADRPGELVFYFDPAGSGSASAANITGGAAVREIRCPVETVDGFAARTGLAPDFVKCDVEGAELAVLQGATGTLRRARPVVFAEMLRKWAASFGYHPDRIIEHLAALGYRCFVTAGEGLAPFARMTEETEETNFFFLHGERHAAAIRELAGGR